MIAGRLVRVVAALFLAAAPAFADTFTESRVNDIAAPPLTVAPSGA